MPSGGITITPGYQLAPGEKVNNTKLNQLGQPVGRVDEGAITARELDPDSVRAAQAGELFCNGDFGWGLFLNQFEFKSGRAQSRLWRPNRWVIRTTPNRTADLFVVDKQEYQNFDKIQAGARLG
jgi:hypothetical protein